MKLTEKSVAVVANATSLLPNGTHTVDHLISLSVDVRQVWAPEHGFRGDADAGAAIPKQAYLSRVCTVKRSVHQPNGWRAWIGSSMIFKTWGSDFIPTARR